MITVILQGGLGNQLFQYAYGRALTALGKEVIFDISFFNTNSKKYTKRNYALNHFMIAKNITVTSQGKQQNIVTRLINKIDNDRKVRYVKISNNKDTYIADGYYNTEKYFIMIRNRWII